MTRESLGEIRRGDRCPGCHVVCASHNTEHLDSCPYRGRLKLVPWTPRHGDRVVVTARSHNRHGEHGVVVARPGAFNGWAVKFADGGINGVGARQMKPEALA